MSTKRKGGEVWKKGWSGDKEETQTRKMNYENAGCHNLLVIDDLQERGFIKMMGKEIMLLGDKFLSNISRVFNIGTKATH